MSGYNRGVECFCHGFTRNLRNDLRRRHGALARDIRELKGKFKKDLSAIKYAKMKITTELLTRLKAM